jgi:hypothetical protein
MINSESACLAESGERDLTTTDAGATLDIARSVGQLGYALPHGLVEPEHGVDHVGLDVRP